MNKSYFDYPFHLDGRGRTAGTDDADHIRDLIFQVLFTSPGERVNRPDFGCSLKQLIFMPNSDSLVTSTQAIVHGALQRWLERVIKVESVSVEAVDSQLKVTVVFTRRTTGERSETHYVQPIIA